MRISDWSSDVCSSDLATREDAQGVQAWRFDPDLIHALDALFSGGSELPSPRDPEPLSRVRERGWGEGVSDRENPSPCTTPRSSTPSGAPAPCSPSTTPWPKACAPSTPPPPTPSSPPPPPARSPSPPATKPPRPLTGK